jgi:hypothetical protein
MSNDKQTGKVGVFAARSLYSVGLSKSYTALIGAVNSAVQ